jgi:hypothetical protein
MAIGKGKSEIWRGEMKKYHRGTEGQENKEKEATEGKENEKRREKE